MPYESSVTDRLPPVDDPPCQPGSTWQEPAEPLSSPLLRKIASGWAWVVVFGSLATATGVLALVDWALWRAR